MAWTTDDLVRRVRRKCMAPSSGWQFSDAEVCDIAWEETIKRVVPRVRAVREDYFTCTIDIPIGANVGTAWIPSQAAASTATSFWIVPQDGTPQRLTRVAASERQRWVGAARGSTYAYSIEGNTIYLLTVPSQPVTLRVQYDRRPAKYVPVSDCAAIAAINIDVGTATTVITANGGTWAASPVIDIVRGEPPLDVIADGLSASYSAGDFTIAEDLSALNLSVSDYIVHPGTTCVPPLPDVLHPVLVDLTASACLGEIGELDERDAIREDVDTYGPDVIQTLAIRVSADPVYVFNRQSQLRTGGGWRRGGWR